MRNWHISPAIGFAAFKLRAPMDAGGSGAPMGDDGGTTDSGTGDEAGAGDPGDDGGASADPERAGQAPAGDEDGDDEDRELEQIDRDEFKDLEQDPRVKKLLARNAKLSKRDRRHTPLVQTLRTLGIDKPEALRELLSRSGAPERAIPNDTRERSAPADEPANQPLPEDLQFDFAPSEAALRKAGWDLDDPLNQGMVGIFRSQAETIHALQLDRNRMVNAMRVIAREVAGGQQQTRNERAAVEKKAWSDEVGAAVATIRDKELATAFRYEVLGRVQAARQAGRRLTPKEAVQATLKRFVSTGQVTSGQAAAADGARQRVADRNRILPRSTAISGAGQPGSPTVDRSRDTIRSIHKRQYGATHIGALGR